MDIDMDIEILKNELNIQKYNYKIDKKNKTITIKINPIRNNIIILNEEKSYLVMEHEGFININLKIPKNITLIPCTNYAMFLVKNKQSIVDSYIDLTSLYYEIIYLKRKT